MTIRATLKTIASSNSRRSADSANQVLEENKITYFKQLCGKTKTQLKNIGLSYKEICDIEIKLQLEGLDLKNNY